MQCHDPKHPQPVDVVADVMADGEHAFGVFPGGVSANTPGMAEGAAAVRSLP
jgi:hypothetical protein